MSTGMLLNLSWHVYVKRFLTFTILVLPSAVWSLFYPFGYQVYLESSKVSTLADLSLLLGFSLLGSLLGVWSYVSILNNLKNPINIGVRASWPSLSGFYSYLWVSILVFLVYLGGSVLLFVPGLLFAVYLYFSLSVAVIEGDKGFEALLRSWQYIRGRWWQMLWRAFVPAAFILPLLFISQFVLKMIDSTALTALFTSLIYLLFLPFAISYSYILFREMQRVYVPTNKPPRAVLVIGAFLGLLFTVVMIGGFVYLTNFIKEVEKMQTLSQHAEYYVDISNLTDISEVGVIASYVTENLNLGYRQGVVREELIRGGWPAQDVDRVLASVRTR